MSVCLPVNSASPLAQKKKKKCKEISEFLVTGSVRGYRMYFIDLPVAFFSLISRE